MIKKIILVAIAILFNLTMYSQIQVIPDTYISLADSGNDKLQYLINNFEDQEAKYIGQPMSKILDDLEIDVKDYLFLHQERVNKRYFAGLILKFYYNVEYDDLSSQDFDRMLGNGEILEIYIKTVDPLLFSDYFTLKRREQNRYWSPNLERFYGPYIVSSVKVAGHENR